MNDLPKPPPKHRLLEDGEEIPEAYQYWSHGVGPWKPNRFSLAGNEYVFGRYHLFAVPKPRYTLTIEQALHGVKE